MKHTFLIEPGHWLARGEFMTGSAEARAVEGEARIEHHRRIWHNAAVMTVHTEPPLEFRDLCEIVPFPRGSIWTSWSSSNPVLGPLAGRFVLVGDTILSLFQSLDGACQGCGSMVFENPVTYRCRGTVLRGGLPLARWSVVLECAS